MLLSWWLLVLRSRAARESRWKSSQVVLDKRNESARAGQSRRFPMMRRVKWNRKRKSLLRVLLLTGPSCLFYLCFIRRRVECT